MEYLKGQIVKPYEVLPDGEVAFTDGTTNNIKVNQPTCEAYGYKYSNTTGGCYAFNRVPQLTQKIENERTIQRGVNNDTGRDTQNNVIIGNNNTLKGLNNNTFILGNRHTVDSGFNNSSIIGGTKGTITRESEVMMGGGRELLQAGSGESAANLYTRRQMSILELSGVTVDNTATNLTIQGDGTSFINVTNNSIIGFDIYINRLELGGTSGTAGNYSYRNIRGAVHIDNSYTMTVTIGFSRNIAKIGVNGTCTMVDSTTGGVPSISVNVTDRNNVQNLWSATVIMHEVVSTKTTF
jgi:hypothetical protein